MKKNWIIFLLRFNLTIKHGAKIVGSVEKMQKIKTWGLWSQKNGRIMALSNSAVCRSKKLKFIKEQEAIGILGNKLRTKILVLRNIPIANILF